MKDHSRKWAWLMIVILCLLASCSVGQAESQQLLVEDVKSAVASSEESIPLSNYGNWKDLQMFGPYTSNESVNESLGRRYYGPSTDMDESNFLLVLVDKDDSLGFALLPRHVLKADGSGIGHKRFINVDYGLNKDSDEIVIKYLPW